MQLRIEKIITGGQGLARKEDGIIVLTRFVLPGELVEVRETWQRRSYVEADLIRVWEPSPDRILPTCSFFTICGGCDFQHLSGTAQLRNKKEMYLEALQRAKIPTDHDILLPVLPSPSLYHYRYRIRLKVDPEGRPGFCRFHSNRIVPIDRCPVATELLNTVLQGLLGFPLPRSLAAVIQDIDLLHSPADDRIHALFLPDFRRHTDRRLLTAFAEKLTGVQIVWLKTRTGIERLAGDNGPDLLRQDFSRELCGRDYFLRWPPGCFSQVNARQNSRLVSLVLRLAGSIAGRKVLDLFCGTGNFTVPLALAGAQVTGVELSRESAAWAENNGAAAGCADIRIVAAEIGEALASPDIKNAGYDLIVLDPPRQGLGKSTDQLAELNAERIIYISCDPATLARDLARLCARGYQLRQLTPVDMFPQTHHIEAVALLEKN